MLKSPSYFFSPHPHTFSLTILYLASLSSSLSLSFLSRSFSLYLFFTSRSFSIPLLVLFTRSILCHNHSMVVLSHSASLTNDITPLQFSLLHSVLRMPGRTGSFIQHLCHYLSILVTPFLCPALLTHKLLLELSTFSNSCALSLSLSSFSFFSFQLPLTHPFTLPYTLLLTLSLPASFSVS